MSKGKGQQAMEHNWSPLEFELPDGKDALQNNVSVMFQLDWPANNRIIAGSLFSHFSGSLFSDFKMLGNTAVDGMATKFLYFEDEY